MEEAGNLAMAPTKSGKTTSPKKRKEAETLETATATNSKKGRPSSKNSKTDVLAPVLAQNGQGVMGVLSQQKLVQFSFGELPALSLQDWSKATILICKRSTVQQIFRDGSELIFEMLGLNLSANILQAMNLDVGSGKSSVSLSSTYVDHPHQSHRFTIVAVPDNVSRSNHPWSIHAITDALKSAVGSSSSIAGNTRVVFCGTDVAERMGCLAATVARAFSVYSRKSGKNVATVSSSKSVIPTVHIAFMIANENGLQEKEPVNASSLQAICESIQLAARLVDMVR
jgi:M17 aminopeptidase N-terminal domain 2